MTWIQSADLLPQTMRRRANDDPDTVFLRHVDGSVQTYGETYAVSLRWANALHRLGVQRGDNVLMMLPNSFDAYHAWLGLAWLGAVEVSLNTAYQGRMLAYTVEASDAKMILVSSELLPIVADIAVDVEQLETVVVVDGEGDESAFAQRVVGRAEFLHAATADPAVTIEPAPWDISCVIWTSGTTGPSKGVMLPWAEMYRFNEIITSVTGSDEIYYHFMPPFHIGGKLIISAAAEQRGSVVIRPVFSRSRFWDDVRAYGCTHVNIQGPMVRMLMNSQASPKDTENPLRTMGCAPLPADLEDFHRRFGISGTNTYYGMTEIGLPLASDGFVLGDLSSCGRLREGYEVRIVDEYDYPVAQGEVGELIVRAQHPWTMNAGYYGMPQETAVSWRNGWFHTGDAFRVDDGGNFYFVDRFKDALRRRGENISSFEVESQVVDHPDVLEVAAVAAASDLGEDDVMVYVVRAEGSTLSESELHEWIVERMPKFMRPRYIEFVAALPKTDATLRTKKIDLRNRGISENTWDAEATTGYVKAGY